MRSIEYCAVCASQEKPEVIMRIEQTLAGKSPLAISEHPMMSSGLTKGPYVNITVVADTYVLTPAGRYYWNGLTTVSVQVDQNFRPLRFGTWEKDRWIEIRNDIPTRIQENFLKQLRRFIMAEDRYVF